MIEITQPTLLIDENIARRNIKKMVTKARKNDIELIPHFKTHQSKEIGGWFKDEGVTAITVSSVTMAEYFAAAGWHNITIAFPLNLLEIDKIERLAAKIELTVLLTDSTQIIALARKVDVFVNVLIEIDTGDHRSGVPADDHAAIGRLINLLKNTQHHFKGFYSHFGHTYAAASGWEVISIYRQSLASYTDLQFVFAGAQPEIHLGDTPSASLIDDFSGVTAVHAGNFIFYDLTQVQIGSCKANDIAVALACPIVSKNDTRSELIIYGGGIHLSKEGMYDKELQTTIYGKLVLLRENAWSEPVSGCYVRAISQEHGVMMTTTDIFSKLKVGDIIGVLPVHSCMTADTMGGYRTFSGSYIDHLSNNYRMPLSGKA